MANSIDFGQWVPAAVAEQYEQYRNNPPVDWEDIRANVTHVIDQFLIHEVITEKEASGALELYNVEIQKLGGPSVTWEQVFNPKK